MTSNVSESSTENSTQSEKTRNLAGLVTVGIFGGLATATIAVALPFVWPAFRRIVLPYVPATTTQVENVLQALKHRRAHLPVKSVKSSTSVDQPRVIDLGSGDGRIVSIWETSIAALDRYSMFALLRSIDRSVGNMSVHSEHSPHTVCLSSLQVIECAKHGMRSFGVELNPW